MKDHDQVRVYFDDGSNTVIHVKHDDDIQAAIAELCDTQGWDQNSVIRFTIEG